MKNRFYFLTIIVISFWGCSPNEVNPPENQFLESAILVKSISATDFKDQLGDAFGSVTGQVAPFIQYGIDQYAINFNTKDVEGNPVIASGAVVLPQNLDGPLAIGSIQHGTLTNEKDAPSYFSFEAESTLGSFLASTGIIIGMPDYIGYGASKNSAHPYEHKNGLAVANVDFIKALKEFITEKGREWNGNLMLAGYSEGGYATMATHKLLQEENASELPVTVSVCGAGAYNKTATLKKLINETGSTDLANNRSYVWVLQTYNTAYNINKPMSYYFKEPYASAIENEGYLTQINVSLNETFKQEFINDFNSGALPELNNALADNDIFDWTPNAPVLLYHGNADQYVPYLNSETAFTAMQANGADVTLKTIAGGTHSSSIADYFQAVFLEFTINKSKSAQ